MSLDKNQNSLNLHDEIVRALITEDVEFVENVEQELSNFVSISTLHRLFEDTMSKDTSMSIIVGHLLKRCQTIEVFHNFGCLFSCKCNQVQDKTLSKVEYLKKVGKLVQWLLHYKSENPFKFMEMQDQLNKTGNIENGQSQWDTIPLSRFPTVPDDGAADVGCICPFKELFLWAVLSDYTKIAHTLLQKCTDPLGGSLFACIILRSIANHAKYAIFQDDTDFKKQIKEEIKYYEKFACGIAYTSYNMNKSNSHDLLTRELDDWGRTTVLSLADSSKLKQFMRLASCQTKLNRIWFGRMAVHTQHWKIVLNLFLMPVFPLFLKFIHFREKETEGTTEAPKRQREEEGNSIPYPKAVYHFYTAPITKFYSHGIAYIGFLLLFTYVLLSEKLSVEVSIRTGRMQFLAEVVLWIWAIVLFMETIRQILQEETTLFLYKFFNHFNKFWNLVDLLMFVMFIGSIMLRVQRDDKDNEMQHSRETYALALVFAFLKHMKAFYVFKAIGPKVIMIRKMLKDLGFFLFILSVFVLGFGIAIQSLLHPDQGFTIANLLNAVYAPYWQMFGEVFIERTEGKECPAEAAFRLGISNSSNFSSCPGHVSLLVPLLTAIYMMLSNVLLLNLLIAMFSYTFEKVQVKAEIVWKFYRYQAVHDYYNCPALPGPLLIVVIILKVFKYLIRKVNHPLPPISSFRERYDNLKNKNLSVFETEALVKFLENSANKRPGTGMHFEELSDSDSDSDSSDGDDSSSSNNSHDNSDIMKDSSFAEITDKMQLLERKLDKQTELLNKLISD